MKKTNALGIISSLIFIVIFNILFFVIGGTQHNVSVWFSYGFIHLACLMVALTPLFIRVGKSAAVFGFSLHAISLVYFVLEFIFGIIFILLALDSYTIALLVQLCLVGFYGVTLITHMIANEHTAEAEEKRQHEIEYVKKASTKLKGYLYTVKDKDIKKKIEKIYDTVYSSPVKTHPSVSQTETQILRIIDEIGLLISSEDKEKIIPLSDSLLTLINERNERLKTYN